VDPQGPERTPHVPPPTLWPVGFAVGIAILLTGLIVGWPIIVLGAVLTVGFGFLWVRDLTADMRGEPVADVEPERRGEGAAPAVGDETALPVAVDDDVDRSTFLSAATIGLGAVIGGIVTVPALGLMTIPPFVDQGFKESDIGPVEDFPEGEWRIATFMENPAEGEVTRHTAFVRNNGELDGSPSFTLIANNCAHLGCPVQPSGPIQEEQKKTVKTTTTQVDLIPTDPAGGFACPCHGGAYDSEGNRTSGPPVRSLDRYTFAVRDGHVILTGRYSVGNVEGTGKEAVITKYDQMPPGVHVDGVEALLYPIAPPS
jgi:menaquinol-cytochrome c reductase iron-sulfur subunit